MSKQPMRGQDTGQMLAQTDLQELLCWNCGNSKTTPNETKIKNGYWFDIRALQRIPI